MQIKVSQHLENEYNIIQNYFQNILQAIKSAFEDHIEIPGAESFGKIFEDDIADAISQRACLR